MSQRLAATPWAGREGIAVIPVRHAPQRSTVGRRPFPILDLRAAPPARDDRTQEAIAWLRGLYAEDLPLRPSTLLAAEDVAVMRGAVWHRGQPIEGSLPARHADDAARLGHWARKIGKLTGSGKAQAFPGTSAIIHAPGARNYYHWMVEIMPRLLLLRAALAEGAVRLDRIVLFYTEDPPPFVAGAIACFAADLQPLIRIADGRACTFERCVFIADQAETDEEFTDHRAHGSRWRATTALLAELIDRRLARLPRGPARSILVSRRDAPKRPLVNEDALRDALPGERLEAVAFSGLNVRDQMRLMADARLVIGAHGAGLTNALFCRPGTPMIELITAPYLKRCRSFADIAAHRGLAYGLVIVDACGAPAEGAEAGGDMRIAEAALPALGRFVAAVAVGDGSG
jgi:capsular polysaccharide biosynthesis protein